MQVILNIYEYITLGKIFIFVLLLLYIFAFYARNKYIKSIYNLDMKKLEKEQYDNYCNQTNMGLYFTSKNIFLEQQDLEQKKHSIELEIERRKIEYKNEKLLLPFTAITQIYNASQIFKK